MEKLPQEPDTHSVRHAEQNNRPIITAADIHVLIRGEALTDSLINFQLMWLHENVIPDNLRDRIHVFRTDFYRTLTSRDEEYNRYNEQGFSKAQMQYSLVADFTKGVNLSEKDFIVVPICTYRWFLAIIALKLSEWPEICQGYEISGEEFAIITDGFGENHIRTLQDFLSEEYHTKKVDSHVRMFANDIMPTFFFQGLRYMEIKHSDLHMLGYLECFFNDFFKKGVAPDDWKPYYEIEKVRSNLVQRIKAGSPGDCMPQMYSWLLP